MRQSRSEEEQTKRPGEEMEREGRMKKSQKSGEKKMERQPQAIKPASGKQDYVWLENYTIRVGGRVEGGRGGEWDEEEEKQAVNLAPSLVCTETIGDTLGSHAHTHTHTQDRWGALIWAK